MLAVAAVSLSAGAAYAQQIVVCSPGCGVTTSQEANANGKQRSAAAGENGNHYGNQNNNANSGGGNTGGGGTLILK